MAVLSYQSIQERLARRDNYRLVVQPWFEGMIQPASLDVQLGNELQVWNDALREWEVLPLSSYGVWFLDPDRFYLGVLRQWIGVPRDLLGKLEGKSSRGRDGIQLHRAGVLDPGWEGNATTEFDVRRKREPLWPGMTIGQVVFEELDSPTAMPYGSPGLGSHYQGDSGVQSSRLNDCPVQRGANGLMVLSPKGSLPSGS